MAQALVKNNAYSTLAADISASVTTITVAVGHGARFPTVSGGNFFFATLINAANTLEIVKVVGRAGDILTVTRGQDGTTGTAYLLGDRIELRPTAALFDDKLSLGGGALTGPLSVPAGAATTQVPQIQEVVKRAGDTMTGPLVSPEITLTTLKGNAGLTNMPTGHRILGVDKASFVAPGMVMQVVNVLSSAVLVTAVAIPFDDTIPQITEGAEVMTLAITPKFATSKLRIDITVMVSNSSSAQKATAALFRDAGANALAAMAAETVDNGLPMAITFTHYMTSPGVVSTTFRTRVGCDANTTTVNGAAGARRFGGVCASSMTITEIAQ